MDEAKKTEYCHVDGIVEQLQLVDCALRPKQEWLRIPRKFRCFPLVRKIRQCYEMANKLPKAQKRLVAATKRSNQMYDLFCEERDEWIHSAQIKDVQIKVLKEQIAKLRKKLAGRKADIRNWKQKAERISRLLDCDEKYETLTAAARRVSNEVLGLRAANEALQRIASRHAPGGNSGSSAGERPASEGPRPQVISLPGCPGEQRALEAAPSALFGQGPGRCAGSAE